VELPELDLPSSPFIGDFFQLDVVNVALGP
jgi:hypothetical protein